MRISDWSSDVCSSDLRLGGSKNVGRRRRIEHVGGDKSRRSGTTFDGQRNHACTVLGITSDRQQTDPFRRQLQCDRTTAVGRRAGDDRPLSIHSEGHGPQVESVWLWGRVWVYVESSVVAGTLIKLS